MRIRVRPCAPDPQERPQSTPLAFAIDRHEAGQHALLARIQIKLGLHKILSALMGRDLIRDVAQTA